MGANVSLLYAGVRPERVRRVVDLEGFGLPAAHPSQALGRIGRWLDDLRAAPGLRSYATLDEVAERLIKTNPRLPLSRARFLAQHWSRQEADGHFHLLADPAHKLRAPYLYRVDEAMATWPRIQVPVLYVEAESSPTLAAFAGEMPVAEFKKRFEAIPDWREEIVSEAGHMCITISPNASRR